VRYALQRLGQFAIVFVVVTFIVLVATRIGSEDPVRDLAGGIASDSVLAQVEEDYPYLDKPLVVQYGYWLTDVLTGDLGRSYALSQTAVEMFQQRLPATFFIGFWAIALGLAIAVPLGVYSAYRRDGWFDRITSQISFGLISFPPLVIAIFLMYLIAVRFSFFPVDSDYVAPWDSPIRHFQNFFLPSLALGLGLAAVWSRLLRADMILTLQSDFVMLARAKGMSPRRVLWGHALRASILSLVTSVALQMSGLVGGAVVVEQLFAMPGIGDRLVFAIQSNDVLTLQAITAVLVGIVVLVNLAVDLLYGIIDPRIRAARALR